VRVWLYNKIGVLDANTTYSFQVWASFNDGVESTEKKYFTSTSVTTPSITLRGFSKAYSALTTDDCPFSANDDTKVLWCNEAKTMTGYFSTKIWISSTNTANFKYFWIGSSSTAINSDNEGGTDG
jgi:hypothetical protein